MLRFLWLFACGVVETCTLSEVPASVFFAAFLRSNELIHRISEKDGWMHVQFCLGQDRGVQEG